ncbi:hypothetical protein HHI36_001565 [Cryptolaemus montrouzieri]|uniref:Peroxisomal membrane protein 11B n=1 Tax=Cryptolaemus montrouzieri TaxID=559131 RepID=A0ABD2P899_9CUCU
MFSAITICDVNKRSFPNYNMDKLVKLNTQTAGRDKIARLLQYMSRFLWHRLQQNHKSGVENLKHLEFQLSTFRKLLRLGRCADILYSALPLLQYEDPTVRVTMVMSKICNSLFLLADHILWLGRADLCNVNTTKWSQISNKAWLYSITMNIIRDLYELNRIIKKNKNSIIPKSGIQCNNDLKILVFNLCIVLNSHREVVIDTVKNACDFFIPFTSLGYTKLSPGTIGLLGVISSIAGLLVLIDPAVKLIPS